MINHKIPHYLLMEKTTFIYMVVLSLLILFFHTNLPHWYNLLGFNLCVCLFMFLVASVLDHKAKGWWYFFRHFYPPLLFTALYEENRYLIHMVFPNLFDHLINRFELAVFGVYPTVWMQKFICAGLNEYMMFAYFSFYFLLLVLGLGLFVNLKIKELDDLFFTSAVAFYISYLGFIFFPVAGPRFALDGIHHLKINGGFFTGLAQSIIEVAGIHGGAMPSSHVAVALVVLIYAKRHHRLLLYVLSPLIFSLFVATVYGRFHYVSDVLAGLWVGGISILLCDRIIREQRTVPEPTVVKKEFSLDLTKLD